MLTWSTEPFETTAEMIGTGAAHLFVETDTDDTNRILRLWDEAPVPTQRSWRGDARSPDRSARR